ncbi:MAG: hypothetical protein JOZ47_15845 [Kutzneria sp.]|nr:hypothetical protein [Kutzneria sp.]
MNPVQRATVATPATDRPARDDPYTRLVYDRLVAGRRRMWLSMMMLGLVLLVAVGPLVALWLLGSGIQGIDALRSLFSLLVLFIALFLEFLVVYRRTRTIRLLDGHAWRPTRVDVVSVTSRRSPAPSVVRDLSGAVSGYLRLSRLPWGTQQVMLRTGRVFLCGPDRRGHALVRVDGLCPPVAARIVSEAKGGQRPQPAGVAGPRPADDPVLMWIQHHARYVMRTIWLRLVGVPSAVVVVLVLLAWSGDEDTLLLLPLPVFFVLAMAFTLMIAMWWRRSKRRREGNVFALLRAADHWTPLPMRLDSWTPGRWFLWGPATGQVWLPDGTTAGVHLSTADISLVADIQAGQTLWVAGWPRTESTMAVGVPGYPIVGRARLSRATP